MKRIKDIKIGLRFNLLISLVLVFVFLVLGIILSNMQRKRILEDVDQRMFEEVQNLTDLLSNEVENNQKLVNLSSQFAWDILKDFGSLNPQGAYVDMLAVNQTDSTIKERKRVQQWYVGNTPVHNNHTIVDAIMEKTGFATATIFQKIDEGYLRVSTNVMNLKGQRAVGTYIPNESDVVKTIEKGETYYGRAFVVNDWYLTAYQPIWVNGKISGILYVGVREKNLEKIKIYFNTRIYYETGYPYLVDKAGKLIIHPNIEGTSIKDEPFFKKMISIGTDSIKFGYEWEGRDKLLYAKYFEPIESYVVVSLYEDEMYAVIKQTRNVIVVSVFIALLIVIAILTYLSRVITSGLNQGVDFANRLSTGDLSATMELDQGDEVGQLSAALNKMVLNLRKSAELAKMVSSGKIEAASETMKDLGNGDLDIALKNMVQNLSESVALATKVSEGDLTTTITKNTDELGELDQALNNMVEKLRAIVSEIQTEAVNLASASSQLSSVSEQLSLGASEQGASTEEVSSSMEQMSANIEQNSENSQETNKIAVKAAKDIEESYKAFTETIGSMKEIAEKITVVSEIAHKIDLLAINAAIEAARAGEHGKGFAVVAGEVRKLAENSHVASKEIEELTEKSVKIADVSGKLLEELVPLIHKTSNLVQEISAASLEQNSGANQINSAIQQLNNVTQQNASSSEEMSSSAEQLSAQADKLKETISYFVINKQQTSDKVEELTKQAESIMATINKLKEVDGFKKQTNNKKADQKKMVYSKKAEKENEKPLDHPMDQIDPGFEKM
jgi:methyl-accepting chemotaxis protein